MSYHLLHGPNTFAPIPVQERWLADVEALPNTTETREEIARVKGCIERAKLRAEIPNQ